MRKEAGQRFEELVVSRLIRAGAEIERNRKLDYHMCVDFCLISFPETVLPKAIDVQLTFQGGNADKLERFRRKLTGRDTLRLYVIVPSGMNAEDAAFQILTFAFVAARDGTFERSKMLGIFLNKRDTYALFDIDERLAQLRQREDPVISADRRILGHIVSLGQNGSVNVLSVENNKVYHMRMGDIAAPKLKAMLKTPEAFEDLLIGCKVTFIPHRRSALSVLLA